MTRNLVRTRHPTTFFFIVFFVCFFKASEEATKILNSIKVAVYGDADHEPNADQVQALMEDVFNSAFPSLLVTHLSDLEFESRKDASHIFKFILQRQHAGQRPGVAYVASHAELIPMLVKGYESPEIALMSGSMLRECLKYEELTRIVLWSEIFDQFFVYVEMPNFDVASDAFVSFRDMLTRHKSLCADFLEKNYDRVFEAYTGLLNSANYVTKRQSLKLLGELLLDRKNFAVMTKYIANVDNLKLMMNLLRDKSKSIQFEAFHVFKVFVANPHKPDPIKQILVKNGEKLVQYLSAFQNDKDDDQFKEEKAFLIREVSNLVAAAQHQ
eukprot:c1186_g1_i1.p1 GENE.c1186_g1_i1~~c1186_g1_i1.p1  ORF type:complete len:327 (-),score=93.70 c1186_g1_i1:319-1299(-)